MIDYNIVQQKLNEEAVKILVLIKEDYYNYMSLKYKDKIDNMITRAQNVVVNQGLSHFNDQTLAHAGRSLGDGKIHFYPDSRGYNTEEAIEKCKKILLHECFHFFIIPNEIGLKDKIEEEMSSYFVEGLVEKESRKFYEKHKDEIEFEKANYGYNINFVNMIQKRLGVCEYKVIFSEDDYIKNIGKYSLEYRNNLKRKQYDLDVITQIVKYFPDDLQRKVSSTMKNSLLREGNAKKIKENLKKFDFIPIKMIEQLDNDNEKEL